MAALAHQAQGSALQGIMDELCNAGCIVLDRGYDATPMLVRFGSLQSLLEPVARYLIKVPAARGGERWAAVPFETFRERCPGAQTSSGVVEIMAQRLDLRWMRGDSMEHRCFHVPPMVLQQANSSCTFGALQS